MRKFKITVNGNLYEVCVEEITDEKKDTSDNDPQNNEKAEIKQK